MRANPGHGAPMSARKPKTPARFPGEHEARKAWRLVLGFFEGNVSKTKAWFAAENPLLGGLTPNDMINMGRGAKLLKLVEHQLDENKPAERATRKRKRAK